MAIVLALICAALSGCAVIKGDVVMRFGDHTVTEAMWSYWLQTYKTAYLSLYNNSKDTLSFWNTEISEGYTYEDYITDIILGHAKQVLIAAYLFDEYGMSFTSSQKDGVEEAIDSLIESWGGKNYLNEALGDMGLNIQTLRSIYYAEEKLETVREQLFGEGGVYAVDDNDREKYYQDNYYCAEWIYVYTSKKPKKTDDGKYLVDNSGQYVFEVLTDEEKTAQQEKLEQIRRELSSGTGFEDVRSKYSEEDLDYCSTYPDGVFLCADDYGNYGYDMVRALSELEIGAYTEFDNGNATVIVKRCALKGYASLTSAELELMVDFEEHVTDEKLGKLIDSLAVDVVISDDVLARYDIKTISGSKYSF